MHTSFDWVIGVDEVGRGPIAGPVSVGLVAVRVADMPQVQALLHDAGDSKKIRPTQRKEIAQRVHDAPKMHACVRHVSAGVIEKKGIRKALHIATMRAFDDFSGDMKKTLVLFDYGIPKPSCVQHCAFLVKGDAREPLIGLASIIAKVARDERMVRMGLSYPEYNFAQHKGYGTRGHYADIRKHGTCKEHRASWIRV